MFLEGDKCFALICRRHTRWYTHRNTNTLPHTHTHTHTHRNTHKQTNTHTDVTDDTHIWIEKSRQHNLSLVDWLCMRYWLHRLFKMIRCREVNIVSRPRCSAPPCLNILWFIDTLSQMHWEYNASNEKSQRQIQWLDSMFLDLRVKPEQCTKLRASGQGTQNQNNKPLVREGFIFQTKARTPEQLKELWDCI